MDCTVAQPIDSPWGYLLARLQLLQSRTFSSSLGRYPRVAPLPLGHSGVLSDAKIKYVTLQLVICGEKSREPNLGPLILKILGVRTQERTLRTPVRTLKRLRDSYSLTHFSTISVPIGLKLHLPPSPSTTQTSHHLWTIATPSDEMLLASNWTSTLSILPRTENDDGSLMKGSL